MKLIECKKKDLFTIPNIMGYFRILLLPFIGAAILRDQYRTEIILLFISALTDFLDGKIARKLNQVTELGKALDPIADKLTLCILFACLAIRNPFARVIAGVMIMKEICMGIMQLIIHKKTGRTTGGALWYGKLCTAALFISLFCYLFWANMPFIVSFVLMLTTCFIIIFTWTKYAILFTKMQENVGENE